MAFGVFAALASGRIQREERDRIRPVSEANSAILRANLAKAREEVERGGAGAWAEETVASAERDPHLFALPAGASAGSSEIAAPDESTGRPLAA
jgi:hypothetical protein